MNNSTATTLLATAATLIDYDYEEDECGASLLDDPWIRNPVRLVYLIVFIVCLTGNLFTIIVIVAHPLMRTSTNFFLANLAVADLLVAVFCILQNMIHIVGFDHGNWPLGELLCKLYVMVLHLVPCTSVGILVCVSVEKYIAVLHPLLALKMLTNNVRVAATVGTWGVSLFMNFPYFHTAKLFTFASTSACGRAGNTRALVSASFIVWYALPLIILLFIYSRIGLVLWKGGRMSQRASSGASQHSNPGAGTWQMSSGRVVVYKKESLLQVPDEQAQKKRKEVSESRRRVIRLLIAVVSSFAILTLPHHARLLHSMWSTSVHCASSWTALLQPLSYITLFISSSMNPFLYAFLSLRFREAVKDILSCRWRRRSRSATRSSRTRTLVSDVPSEHSRTPSPAPPAIRMQVLREREGTV